MTNKKNNDNDSNTLVKRSCSTVQVHFGLLDKYPEFRKNQAKIQHFTNYYRQTWDAARRVAITNIPVVVHVVYKTEKENISDAQVKSQIKVLNEDFRAKNTDITKVPKPFKELVADARIEFSLAQKDPDGRPTNGINRVKTDNARFTINDDVKSAQTGGIEPWDTKHYLNIWVCSIAGNILGYAQFPGGSPDTDGVVILNRAFGTTGTAEAPFNKGRTTTHEIGHFLNLSHIWGESRIPTCSDSDYVSDTPNQFGPNTQKPTFPHISCNNGPHGDLFMNYMDYVDDDTMFMFTHEQVMRMQAVLNGARSELGKI